MIFWKLEIVIFVHSKLDENFPSKASQEQCVHSSCVKLFDNTSIEYVSMCLGFYNSVDSKSDIKYIIAWPVASLDIVLHRFNVFLD